MTVSLRTDFAISTTPTSDPYDVKNQLWILSKKPHPQQRLQPNFAKSHEFQSHLFPHEIVILSLYEPSETFDTRHMRRQQKETKI